MIDQNASRPVRSAITNGLVLSGCVPEGAMQQFIDEQGASLDVAQNGEIVGMTDAIARYRENHPADFIKLPMRIERSGDFMPAYMEIMKERDRRGQMAVITQRAMDGSGRKSARPAKR